MFSVSADKTDGKFLSSFQPSCQLTRRRTPVLTPDLLWCVGSVWELVSGADVVPHLPYYSLSFISCCSLEEKWHPLLERLQQHGVTQTSHDDIQSLPPPASLWNTRTENKYKHSEKVVEKQKNTLNFYGTITQPTHTQLLFHHCQLSKWC